MKEGKYRLEIREKWDRLQREQKKDLDRNCDQKRREEFRNKLLKETSSKNFWQFVKVECRRGADLLVMLGVHLPLHQRHYCRAAANHVAGVLVRMRAKVYDAGDASVRPVRGRPLADSAPVLAVEGHDAVAVGCQAMVQAVHPVLSSLNLRTCIKIRNDID